MYLDENSAFVFLQHEKEAVVYLDEKDGSTTAASEAKLDAAAVHDEESWTADAANEAKLDDEVKLEVL